MLRQLESCFAKLVHWLPAILQKRSARSLDCLLSGVAPISVRRRVAFLDAAAIRGVRAPARRKEPKDLSQWQHRAPNCAAPMQVPRAARQRSRYRSEGASKSARNFRVLASRDRIRPKKNNSLLQLLSPPPGP